MSIDDAIVPELRKYYWLRHRDSEAVRGIYAGVHEGMHMFVSHERDGLIRAFGSIHLCHSYRQDVPIIEAEQHIILTDPYQKGLAMRFIRQDSSNN